MCSVDLETLLYASSYHVGPEAGFPKAILFHICPFCISDLCKTLPLL